MKLTSQIAKHLKDVHFGGNWTCSNLEEALNGITWQQATTKVYTFNTIAALVYHINYYISAVSKVLEGEELNAHDKYSYDLPPISSKEDWDNLLNKTWREAEHFSKLIELLPDSRLNEDISEAKYGNYFRNLHGIIEHTHYHLGQIVIIRKIIEQEKK